MKNDQYIFFFDSFFPKTLPNETHGLYMYDFKENSENFFDTSHLNSIVSDIVEAFLFENFYYICYGFNINSISDQAYKDKYKYHKYECYQISKKTQLFQTF